MKFLITNDDGIDAPGIEALFAAAAAFGEPVMVAPVDSLSGCSHQVTTDGPIRVEPRGPNRYAVSGTPADCVRVALHRLVPDTTWILSSVNAGGNLGADVWHSGTVAAVREAVLHGWPGIAFSQYRKRSLSTDWQRAAQWAGEVISRLLERPKRRGSFWNVNFPHVSADDPDPSIVDCPLDSTPLPLNFRHEGDDWFYSGDYHQRRRDANADVDVCFRGNIAVTEIRLF
jgi:5'-nucleotidase